MNDESQGIDVNAVLNSLTDQIKELSLKCAILKAERDELLKKLKGDEADG